MRPSVRKFVDLSTTGYVYHPSPPLPRIRRGSHAQSAAPFEGYSLVASLVVLQHLADGLIVNVEEGRGPGEQPGGELEWHGRTYSLGVLPTSGPPTA